VKFETVSFLSKIEIRTAEEIEREEEERRERLMRALQPQHAEAQSVFTAVEPPPAPPPGSEVTYAQVPGVVLPGAPMGAGQQSLPHPLPEPQGTFVRGERKVGRNELCPCGSGKKFKHCHGTLTSVE
jgi:preprotein translocase subunit SecA